MECLLSATLQFGVTGAGERTGDMSQLGSGYAASLLEPGQPGHALTGGRALLVDALWLGGLSVAGAVAWRLLAAHPTARLLAAGYLAAEGLFYLYGKWR